MALVTKKVFDRIDIVEKSADADLVVIPTWGWNKKTKERFASTTVADRKRLEPVNCININPEKDDLLVVLLFKDEQVEEDAE